MIILLSLKRETHPYVRMQVYRIAKKDYYYVDDLKDQPCFIGCSGSNSRFIKARKLEEDVDFNYFKYVNGKYIVSQTRTKGTYLMVSKDWVDSYHELDAIERKVEPPLLSVEAPFVDSDGVEYKVEMRGSRNWRECYFLARDIAQCFGIKYLETNIQRTKNTHYIINEHYCYFIKKAGVKTKCEKNSRMFLTYKGLLRVAFNTQSKKADSFVDWVCSIVFAIQLGTMEQKQELVNTIGLDKRTVKQCFDACAMIVSGVYLIRLGTVLELRDILSIPDSFADTLTVYKYGRSENIAARYTQHCTNYAKIGITDITLTYYCPLDESTVVQAEAYIKEHLVECEMKLDHANHTEIVIAKENSRVMKRLFEQLHKLHQTSNVTLTEQLKTANQTIESLRHELEMQRDKYECVLQAEREKHENSVTSFNVIIQTLKDKYQSAEAKYVSTIELLTHKLQSKDSKIKRRDKKIAKLTK